MYTSDGIIYYRFISGFDNPSLYIGHVILICGCRVDVTHASSICHYTIHGHYIVVQYRSNMVLIIIAETTTKEKKKTLQCFFDDASFAGGRQNEERRKKFRSRTTIYEHRWRCDLYDGRRSDHNIIIYLQNNYKANGRCDLKIHIANNSLNVFLYYYTQQRLLGCVACSSVYYIMVSPCMGIRNFYFYFFFFRPYTNSREWRKTCPSRFRSSEWVVHVSFLSTNKNGGKLKKNK
jgi:hypothetical protein